MNPSTLYKYLAPARVDVLQNLKVRFTQVSALNDPFESLPGATVESADWYRKYFQRRVDSEIAAMLNASREEKRAYARKRAKDFPNFLKCYTDKKYLAELSEKVQQMSNTVSGCFSLSANCTNILMWSHYAQNHTGFVIGFDANHDFFGPSVGQVKYSKTRPKINPLAARHDGTLFYSKSDDWSYEEEYRKYVDFVEAEALPGGNSFLPYDEKLREDPAHPRIHLEPIPSESISCVILGWKSSQHLKQSLHEALEGNGLRKVPIRQALPSLTDYKMQIAT